MPRFDLSALPDILMMVVKSGIPWLKTYGLWTIALGMFAETLVFTGLVVPGVTLLIATGYLIADGFLPLFPTLPVACFATICGDQASYWLGYYWGARILRKKQVLAARLGAALETQGILLLLSYHYASRFRCLFPCVVGSMHYDPKRYLVFDSIGACLWIPAMLGLGYAAHGVVHRSGTLAFCVLSGFASLIMLYTTVRLYRQVSRPDPV